MRNRWSVLLSVVLGLMLVTFGVMGCDDDGETKYVYTDDDDDTSDDDTADDDIADDDTDDDTAEENQLSTTLTQFDHTGGCDFVIFDQQGELNTPFTIDLEGNVNTTVVETADCPPFGITSTGLFVSITTIVPDEKYEFQVVGGGDGPYPETEGTFTAPAGWTITNNCSGCTCQIDGQTAYFYYQAPCPFCACCDGGPWHHEGDYISFYVQK